MYRAQNNITPKVCMQSLQCDHSTGMKNYFVGYYCLSNQQDARKNLFNHKDRKDSFDNF